MSFAKENLGTNASLVAAAALMIDYVLNVAVGISAGVAALVSAFPNLHAYMLPVCLGMLAWIRRRTRIAACCHSWPEPWSAMDRCIALQ
jgi:hypothetical protein